MTGFQKKNRETWILVINANHARILRGMKMPVGERRAELEVLSEHQRLQDVVADRPGRSHPPGPGSRRSAMEYGSDPLEHGFREFLAEVMTMLETHLERGHFARLAVFASPAVLGHLRDSWTPTLAEAVAVEVPKNIVELASDEIETRAEEALRALSRA